MLNILIVKWADGPVIPVRAYKLFRPQNFSYQKRHIIRPNGDVAS